MGQLGAAAEGGHGPGRGRDAGDGRGGRRAAGQPRGEKASAEGVPGTGRVAHDGGPGRDPGRLGPFRRDQRASGAEFDHRGTVVTAKQDGHRLRIGRTVAGTVDGAGEDGRLVQVRKTDGSALGPGQERAGGKLPEERRRPRVDRERDA